MENNSEHMHEHGHDEHGHAPEGNGGMKMGTHHRWHWGCCILPIVTTLLWLAALVFITAAWVAVMQRKLVWGLPADWLVVNALMFGVASLFGRGRKSCWGHGCCAPGTHMEK